MAPTCPVAEHLVVGETEIVLLYENCRNWVGLVIPGYLLDCVVESAWRGQAVWITTDEPRTRVWLDAFFSERSDPPTAGVVIGRGG